jgi:hypothetical protein
MRQLNITPFAHYWGSHYTYMVYLLTLRVMSVTLQMFRYSEPFYTLGWITVILRLLGLCVSCECMRLRNASGKQCSAMILKHTVLRSRRFARGKSTARRTLQPTAP